MFAVMRSWNRQRWTVAVMAGVAAYFLMGLPTAVIDNPVFGRAVAVTPWSGPVLIVSSVLVGLIMATYVNPLNGVDDRQVPVDRHAKLSGVGGLLSFFAIGCPVCNKIVLLALGTSGALNFFAPLQPILAIAGVAFLGYALVKRLRNEQSCALTIDEPTSASR
jgi:hypothetical protein